MDVCLFSEDFVISAGCVLFSKDKSAICILHELKKDEWLLPKGRKDVNEPIQDAAVRETYEETGYPCCLMPLKMNTRAPSPGTDLGNVYRMLDGGCEPMAIHVRPTGEKREATKVVFWFVGQATTNEQVRGTQLDYESFESVFVPLKDASAKMTYPRDSQIIERAIQLVEGSNVLQQT